MKLLPGMTANLAFQIEKRTGVPAVPNAALRFRPKPEQVRAERPGDPGKPGQRRRRGRHGGSVARPPAQHGAMSGSPRETCWPPSRS